MVHDDRTRCELMSLKEVLRGALARSDRCIEVSDSNASKHIERRFEHFVADSDSPRIWFGENKANPSDPRTVCPRKHRFNRGPNHSHS